MVQVHHDEGVANRIDPESCADAREGIGEALTGERIGQPLSRESTLILGADVVPVTEGNTDGRDSASAQTARRGLRHWHVRTLFAREPGDLMVGQRQHACCTPLLSRRGRRRHRARKRLPARQYAADRRRASRRKQRAAIGETILPPIKREALTMKVEWPAFTFERWPNHSPDQLRLPKGGDYEGGSRRIPERQAAA